MWIIVALFVGVYSTDGYCRVLALGGGTDKGAYQAGGIIGLVNSLPEGEAQWDVVTGVGTGAINGLIVSQFMKGQEAEMSAKLMDFWTNFETRDFYTDWFGLFINAYYFKPGFLNTKAMGPTLKNLQSGQFQRFLGVGTTDLITGNYVFFNTTGQTDDTMSIGILASAADPGMFPFVEYKNFKLVSGAIRESVEIILGINACEEMGFEDSQVIIDMVMSSGKSVKVVDPSNYNTLQALSRYLDIQAYNSQLFVISNAKQIFTNVNFRSIIMHSEDMPEPRYPYNYSKKWVKKMISYGETDAITAVQAYLSS